jgi:hypothetical protein
MDPYEVVHVTYLPCELPVNAMCRFLFDPFCSPFLYISLYSCWHYVYQEIIQQEEKSMELIVNKCIVM